MPRQYPLHVHVSTLFLTLIIMVGGLLLCVGYITSRDLINTMADDLTERISRETTGEFQKILRPVETVVSVLTLDELTKTTTLDQRMKRLPLIRNLLDRHPVLSSVYVGYANGDFFMIRHVQSETERLRLQAPIGTKYVIQSIEHAGALPRGHYLYLDAQLHVQEHISRPDYPATYDPRQRSWYNQALQSENTTLTSPYLFFSDRQVGITMAMQAKQQGVVVGADIQLQTLSTSLSKQKVTPLSQLALLDVNGVMIAHEDTAQLVHMPKNGDQPQLATLETFGAPILKKIFQDIDLHTLPPSGWLRQTVFTESETWQVSINKLQVEGAEALLLLIAVPKHELLAVAYAQTRIAAIATLLIVFLSIPVAWWVAHSISRPLVTLTHETDAIRRFEFGRPFELQSQIVELNKLASTIAKMKRTIQQFLELSDAISEEQDFDRLLPKLLGETVSVADATSGILYLNEAAGLVPICALNADRRNLTHQELRELHSFPVPRSASDETSSKFATNSLLERALTEEKIQAAPLSTSDATALGLTDAIYQGEKLYAVAVPLLNRRRELTGAMMLLSSQASEQDLLSFIDAFSGTAAVTLEAQAMLKEQKELFESFIRLVADSIDTKSAYTGGHCARVPELVKMLAQAACEAQSGPYQNFKMTDSDWETLRIAAWLHDCGKVTTPEYVVDKATKLETIYNRIHEVRTRFEVLKRDAELRHLQRLLDGENESVSKQTLENEWHAIDQDFALVAECNEGTEVLSEDKCLALAKISQRTWVRTLDNRLGISHEEKSRMDTAGAVPVPAVEQVLSDRTEHRITRSAHDTIPVDNRWGFRMEVPELLYNLGELHNLCIRRGTLTQEERYKINEHIVQTEIMLSKLPFPKRLQRVTSIASAHHEKLDGSGYPKGLDASQLLPEARMLAIADIFEALTATDRPYKKGLMLSEAVKIMAQMKDDHHIDADLFEIFLRSGVYHLYAERYMRPEQIDAVTVSSFVA